MHWQWQQCAGVHHTLPPCHQLVRRRVAGRLPRHVPTATGTGCLAAASGICSWNYRCSCLPHCCHGPSCACAVRTAHQERLERSSMRQVGSPAHQSDGVLGCLNVPLQRPGRGAGERFGGRRWRRCCCRRPHKATASPHALAPLAAVFPWRCAAVWRRQTPAAIREGASPVSSTPNTIGMRQARPA